MGSLGNGRRLEKSRGRRPGARSSGKRGRTLVIYGWGCGGGGVDAGRMSWRDGGGGGSKCECGGGWGVAGVTSDGEV